MYEQSLIQAGLSYAQAVVYEALIKNGPLPAGKLTKKTPFKRGLVYLALEDLTRLDLVEKNEDKKQAAIFQAKHPASLRALAEKREQQAKDTKLALDGILPSIVSDFNLISGRPGILFYEGEEGLKKILFDSLSSKTEIRLFINTEAFSKEEKFWKIDKDYRRKRLRLGIKKKILSFGKNMEKEASSAAYDRITEIRQVNPGKDAFLSMSAIQIYDNKVSYQIIDKENIIGILIEDRNIFEMHKMIFDLLWEKARSESKELQNQKQ